MIISDRYRFIFIHIPKTGGLSITRALKDQRIVRNKPSRVQRVMSALGINKNYQSYRFRTHGTLQSVERIMPVKLFKAYTKFSVVRNPWTRLVSEYEYFFSGSEVHADVLKRRRHAWVKNIDNFRDFVHRKADREDATQFYYLKNHDEKLGIDVILKQETLDTDYKKLCRRLDLRCSLSHHNVTVKKKPLNDYYDRQLSDFVARHWEIDLKAFNYKIPTALLD